MSKRRPEPEMPARYFPPRELPKDHLDLASQETVQAILVMILHGFPLQSDA